MKGKAGTARGEIITMTIMDNLVGNEDRHLNNFGIHLEGVE